MPRIVLCGLKVRTLIRLFGHPLPEGEGLNGSSQLPMAMLELLAAAARAWIVAAELFEKLLLAVNDAQALLDLRFRWEPFPALTGALEKRARRDVRWILP